MDHLPPHVLAAIRRFRDFVSTRYRVDGLLLFGSWARGRAHEWSDVDLLVVSRDFLPGKRVEVIEFLADAATAAGADPYVPLAPLAVATHRFENSRPAEIYTRIKKEGIPIA